MVEHSMGKLIHRTIKIVTSSKSSYNAKQMEFIVCVYKNLVKDEYLCL